MLLAIIAFVVVVMVTALIHQLNFDYAWYVAIGVGSVFTILVFMVCGMLVDVSVPAGSLVLGAILGGVLGVIVQMCKSVIDYSHKESVQFEDDDYYYYVKAVPKKTVAVREVTVKHFGNTASMGKRIDHSRSVLSPEEEENSRKVIAKELDIDEDLLK